MASHLHNCWSWNAIGSTSNGAFLSDIKLCVASESDNGGWRELYGQQKRIIKDSIKFKVQITRDFSTLYLPITLTKDFFVKVLLPMVASQVYSVEPLDKGVCVSSASLPSFRITIETPDGLPLLASTPSMRKRITGDEVSLVAMLQKTRTEEYTPLLTI